MKPACIVYVPPPSFPGAASFLRNLQKYPPSGELLIFSDHDYPGAVKLRANPEVFKGKFLTDGKPYTGSLRPGEKINEFSHNNAIWMAGLKIAAEKGYTHICYVEADCRFGVKDWDQIIFDEYFRFKTPYICAGTLVCWDPYNDGLKTARAWESMSFKYRDRKWPIATYGWRQAKPCIFPNGALGVYDMAWMQKLFNLEDAMEVIRGHAWDFNLGRRIWNILGPESFEAVGHMETLFSTWGDSLSTVDDRIKLLRDGACCASHQFKGEIEI